MRCDRFENLSKTVFDYDDYDNHPELSESTLTAAITSQANACGILIEVTFGIRQDNDRFQVNLLSLRRRIGHLSAQQDPVAPFPTYSYK